MVVVSGAVHVDRAAWLGALARIVAWREVPSRCAPSCSIVPLWRSMIARARNPQIGSTHIVEETSTSNTSSRPTVEVGGKSVARDDGEPVPAGGKVWHWLPFFRRSMRCSGRDEKYGVRVGDEMVEDASHLDRNVCVRKRQLSAANP